jgi:transcriptional regulator with XRE-family HTH domain
MATDHSESMATDQSMTTAELVGRNIRRFRKALGLKQAALAEMCGYTAQASGTISKIERGQTAIDVNVVGRIARALEVHPSKLFQDEALAETDTSHQADLQPPVARATGVQFLTDLPNPVLTLVILEAHCVIEEQLVSVVSEYVLYPEAIKNERFSYPHLLAMTKALSGRPRQQWLWQSLEELNALRNMLVHAPKSKEFETQIEKFLLPIERIMEPAEGRATTNLPRRIALAVAFMNTTLNQFRKGTKDEHLG